ncbi:DUF4044 domain-containing protein [Schleiferilactobacillus perolens]|nr:DUF4044 domain-containing protein [Schleiferilactobacillus perolens]MCI1892491.1 DUF4044 domain-containing protein [Schleiferilactobacillus harbinensis]MCI1913341.1 DUF4044 domain-containing protein [Schleiferilactobacillus harbinensis]MCI2171969.1 DUF4044 domain-containing protein [Schleiferilactobacillus perolens]
MKNKVVGILKKERSTFDKILHIFIWVMLIFTVGSVVIGAIYYLSSAPQA